MSRWNAPNAEHPTWMLVLLDEPPPCFSAAEWQLYLGGVRDEALGDQALRRRMERGGLPRYCDSCLPEHQARMAAAGKCFPQTSPTPAPERVSSVPQ